MLRRAAFSFGRPLVGRYALRNASNYKPTSTAYTVYQRRVSWQYRTYAEEVSNQYMTLTLATPHEPIFNKKKIDQVTLPTGRGIVSLLPGHVPIIAEVRPGTIRVNFKDDEGGNQEQDKRYFSSGGMVHFFPNNTCTIACPEIVPLEDLDPDVIQSGLTQWQDKLSKATTEDEKTAAEIGVYMHDTMLASLRGVY